MKVIPIEKMPTAVTANRHAVHNWFNFVAGYSPEYVYSVITEYLEKNDEKIEKIYDPFAGSATTNAVANSLGIPSIGVERNPFFYKIGKAKTNAKFVVSVIDDISQDLIEIYHNDNMRNNLSSFKPSEVWSKDASEFLQKLFEYEDLYFLYLFKEKVQSYVGEKNEAGYIFLSKILEYVTFAKTDGIYKVPTSKKNNVPIIEAIERTKTDFQMDSEVTVKNNNLAEFIFGSSVDYIPESNSLDLVIFSPPYLNNFDFAEMTRMQMYFWNEASSWRDISEKHRNHMIVNTTTALKLVRDPDIQEAYKNELPEEVVNAVSPIVDELHAIRKENFKKKDYYLIVYPYLYQMMKVISNSYHGLKLGGEIHIVVSDAAFYGIHVDTEEYLESIMRSVGFSSTRIIRMRDRGDRWKLEKRKSSGKQLGEFEIIGVK
ncbi:hypothetical protein [Ectobacillus polymachus]|uniref:hypothetical protein n=1 Tax=Ectobacillus polymachus TaxID=1508806 RepID=UPI003A8696CB